MSFFPPHITVEASSDEPTIYTAYISVEAEGRGPNRAFITSSAVHPAIALAMAAKQWTDSDREAAIARTNLALAAGVDITEGF